MFRAALVIAKKDLRLTLGTGRRGGGFLPAQIVLLGLLVIFLFSLAPELGATDSGQDAALSPALAAVLFWVVSLLAQTLIFQRLYGLEQSSGIRLALLTAPITPQAVWLGKFLAGLALLALTQAALGPVLILLLRQSLSGALWPALAGLLLADLGLAAMGALLGAFCAASDKRAGRGALPAILSLPLLIPLLLAASRLCQLGLSPAVSLPASAAAPWLGLLAAFDALVMGAALVLFPFVFREE